MFNENISRLRAEKRPASGRFLEKRLSHGGLPFAHPPDSVLAERGSRFANSAKGRFDCDSACLRYAASFCRAAPLMIAAPFSAIIIVGTILFEITAGIEDAQPVDAVHLELVVDDRHSAARRHAGAGGTRQLALSSAGFARCTRPMPPGSGYANLYMLLYSTRA